MLMIYILEQLGPTYIMLCILQNIAFKTKSKNGSAVNRLNVITNIIRDSQSCIYKLSVCMQHLQSSSGYKQDLSFHSPLFSFL